MYMGNMISLGVRCRMDYSYVIRLHMWSMSSICLIAVNFYVPQDLNSCVVMDFLTLSCDVQMI